MAEIKENISYLQVPHSYPRNTVVVVDDLLKLVEIMAC
jgi:hypothetical protein